MTNTTGPAQTDATPPAERVIGRLRPHARAMFWPSLVLVAICAAVGYLGGRFAEEWENYLIYAIGAALALLVFLLPLAIWLSKRYTITDRRLILRRGFFVRVRQELLHSRGYDVTVTRTWGQSLFRTGDIRINAGLEQPVVVRDVPRAGLVQSALQDLMERSQNVVSVQRQSSESTADQTRVWGAR